MSQKYLDKQYMKRESKKGYQRTHSQQKKKDIIK